MTFPFERRVIDLKGLVADQVTINYEENPETERLLKAARAELVLVKDELARVNRDLVAAKEARAYWTNKADGKWQEVRDLTQANKALMADLKHERGLVKHYQGKFGEEVSKRIEAEKRRTVEGAGRRYVELVKHLGERKKFLAGEAARYGSLGEYADAEECKNRADEIIHVIRYGVGTNAD
ncbi:hypothetical protein ACN20G_23605 [Streptomyces sp. BI20]|uniref:hypothetical protein n=1 Tax=Streptomyces sp. BI20 TaxID=3403460 RepID=UPI003C72D2C9